MDQDLVVKNCINYVLCTRNQLFKLEDIYKHFNLNANNISKDEFEINMSAVRQACRLFRVSPNNFIKVQIKLECCKKYNSDVGCNQRNKLCNFLHICEKAVNNESCYCNRDHTLYTRHNEKLFQQQGIYRFSSNLMLDYLQRFLPNSRKRLNSNTNFKINKKVYLNEEPDNFIMPSNFTNPRKDILIVLDINGTLLRRIKPEKRPESKRSPNYYEPDHNCNRDWIYMRPYLKKLSQYLNQNFSYMFWTTATPKYSLPMVDLLAEHGFTEHITTWSQDKCEYNANSSNPNFKIDLKNLQKVHKELKFDLNKIYLVDDSEYKVLPSQNLIQIQEFDPFSGINDNELLRIIDVLSRL